MKKTFLIALCLCAVTSLFTGCANFQTVRVQPWERGTLADYTMSPDRDPLGNQLAEHIYFSREAATGGAGVGGAGCGCN
ncbi:MAG: DUF4266 domain-containing protein [Verrucomicrobiota bacterium]|jgi:hypothetical protein|nr:MAG: DUF4266 domain-containing protein [Verrucomicrobiota bacterium]